VYLSYRGFITKVPGDNGLIRYHKTEVIRVVYLL
jgi:hypothetical protein